MTMKKKVYVKQIGVPVSEEMYRELLDLCNKQELSVSEWIRDAIGTKLSQLHENQNQQTTEK